MRADMDWVEEQLKAVGYTGIGAARVKELVATLSDSDFTQNEKKEVEKVLDMAKNLFFGIPVDQSGDDSDWTQAERGYINRKDAVKVKSDAYLGRSGVRHNGKTGHVVGINGDNITVIYDEETADDAVIHKLSYLLKKM